MTLIKDLIGYTIMLATAGAFWYAVFVGGLKGLYAI